MSLEPATPRGLAATVLQHLDAGTVASVAGAEGPRVMVTSDGDAFSTIYVDVGQQLATPTCRADSGFRVLNCLEGDTFIQTMVRTRGGGRPAFIARAVDLERGAVVIELWGTDTPESRELLTDLVSDAHVGLVTTDALNEAGEGIENFDELHIGFTDEQVETP